MDPGSGILSGHGGSVPPVEKLNTGALLLRYGFDFAEAFVSTFSEH